jgi:uncharacterized HAD superfamily protein
MKQKERKVYAVDIDGVLCKERRKGWLSYSTAKPIWKNISKVNRLFDEGHIILIYTARLECDREVTEQWLRENKVKYTALILGKLRADYYIDDKNEQL